MHKPPIKHVYKKALVFCVASLVMASISWAELKPETVGNIFSLPAEPGPHWVWVNDMVFDYMADGRSYLIDGDTGHFLGMLSTGYSFTALTLPSDYAEIYSAETHYSRTTRGDRTDIVAIYDPASLSVLGEVVIPPKRQSTIPNLYTATLTDDNRFMAIFNMTPAISLSIVDLVKRRFVGEISTPGCSLVYPSGDRQFSLLCSNGALMTLTLNEEGQEASKEQSEPFFDPLTDPVTEKAIRYGETWLFVSFAGLVHPVDVSGDAPLFGKPWSLLSDAERNDSWRIGGFQHLAVHQSSGRLYSIMHRGGPYSRKDSGRDIWVYEVPGKKRVKKIKTDRPTGLIQVTQDDAPLLFTAAVEENVLHVYDADSGAYLRSVEVGYTPSGLQTPWIR